MKKLMLSTAFIAMAGFAMAQTSTTADVGADVGAAADATTSAAGTDTTANADANANVDAAADVAVDPNAMVDPNAAAQTDTNIDAATSADVAARTPVIRDGFEMADNTSLTSDVLIGAKVYDAEDNSVGEVSELVIDADNKMTDVVIDVGGFLGMGEKPVALKVADIDILKATANGEVRVYVSMTKDQLKAMPDYVKG